MQSNKSSKSSSSIGCVVTTLYHPPSIAAPSPAKSLSPPLIDVQLRDTSGLFHLCRHYVFHFQYAIHPLHIFIPHQLVGLLLLWVNVWACVFDHPLTYTHPVLHIRPLHYSMF